MSVSGSYTVHAVKTVQHWEEKGDYWIPRIYEELKKGRARFGWSYFDDADLRKIAAKIKERGWENLSDKEKDCWKHARFMLEEVKPSDYFVYINMPKYGKCSLVKVTGNYEFTEVWDDQGEGDFRHCLPCEFVGDFERRSNIVHPYLQTKLGLRGAWYRIYAPKEFEELLVNIKEGREGKDVRERLKEIIDEELDNLCEKLHRLFPRKNLEYLLVNVFRNFPGVVEVRRTQELDRHGVDIEIVYETGLQIGHLAKQERCAVQVKSYEQEMRGTEAVEDIRRAFEWKPDYTSGLIVTTATKIGDECYRALKALEQETGKEVTILYGTELARLLLKHGYE